MGQNLQIWKLILLYTVITILRHIFKITSKNNLDMFVALLAVHTTQRCKIDSVRLMRNLNLSIGVSIRPKNKAFCEQASTKS